MPRRVLVTGATGVLGRELVPLLESRGAEIHTASRRDADLPRHLSGDLADSTAAAAAVRSARPNAIVHLAGGHRTDAEALLRDNVLTTMNVLAAAAEQGRPAAVIAMGSAAEYGEPESARIDETFPLAPVSDYGRAKAAQTLLAEVVAARGGVPLTVVRPFNVVAPRLSTATALGNITSQLLQQSGRVRTIRCGRLDIVRDFIPSSFVADVLAALAFEPSPGILNVCSGRAIELRDVIDALAAELNVEVDVEPVEELVRIPAAARVVGDPRRLASLGFAWETTAESIARTLLGR